MTIFENIIKILSWILMVIGLLFCAIGVLGMFRMPDLFSKQHAAGLIDTLGFLSISFSLALQGGLSVISLKIILLGFLASFLSAPICNAFIKSAVINKLLPKSTNKE